MPKEKGIKNVSKLRKEELIELLNNNIEKNECLKDENEIEKIPNEGTEQTGYKLTNDGDNIVEGILEVLPDGYGFLRGENYLSSPKDVYISPVQIRRFKLDKGDKIKGISRMPKKEKKFPALIYVGEVNGEAPEMAYKRKKFDDLTPIYPNERIRLETVPNRICNENYRFNVSNRERAKRYDCCST